MKIKRGKAQIITEASILFVFVAGLVKILKKKYHKISEPYGNVFKYPSP